MRSLLHRLCTIDDLLRSNTFPNARSLARKLRVTQRTVRRDLAFLKKHRHLPIAYDPRRFGFYYAHSVDGPFPFSNSNAKAAMSQADISALTFAYKAFAQQHPAIPFAKPLRRAVAKLVSSAQLDQRTAGRPGPQHRRLHSLTHLSDALSFRPFAPEDCDPRSFNTINKAVTDRRELKFNYRNWAQKTVHTRRVQPYHLVCFDTRWYLLGYDHARQTVRTFALCRLGAPRLMRRRFPRPKRFDPNEYLEGSLGVMKGDADYEVVIEFDPAGADLIRSRRLHPTQELLELPGGGARLRLILSGLEEIERLVLSWGTHATVIRPLALRKRLAALSAELASRYERP